MAVQHTRILVVEDEPAHAEAISRSLEEVEGAELRILKSLQEFREQGLAWNPDIALLDLNLPDGRATEVLVDPGDSQAFPVIVMTSYGNEKTAVEALKSGALDYLVKSPEAFISLPRTLERWLREWQLLQDGKRVQQALKESEELFQSILGTTQDGFWVSDLEGRLLQVNDAYCHMSGYGRTELLAMTIADFEVLETAPEVEGHIRAIMLKGADRFETRHRRKDGSTYGVEITVQCKPDRAKALIVFIRDITERKQAEEIRRESAAQNRALLHAIPDLIFMHDRDGKYLAIHAPDPNLLILPSKTLLHLSVEEVLPDAIAKQLIQAIKNALALGTVQEVNYSLPMKGSEIHFEARVSPCTADTVITLVRDVTSRKMTEQALRESEERYRTQFDRAVVGIYTCSVEGDLLEVNAAFAQMHGYTLEEMGRMSLKDLDTPEAHQLAAERMHRLQNGKALQFEVDHLHKDGHVFPTEVSTSLISSGGRPILLCFQRDITERKDAEAALQGSEDLFRNLTTLAPVGIYLTDTAGNCLYANPRLCEMAGLNAEEASGLGWVQGLHPEDRALVFSTWQQTVESEGRWGMEYRFQTAQGKVTWVHGIASPQCNAAGEIIGYVGINSDITERKQSETVLQETMQRLQLATASAHMGVWDWDIQAGTMLWDDRMFELYGATREEIQGTGQDWLTGLHPEDLERALAEWEAALKGEAPYDTEFRVKHKDGMSHWIKADGLVIRNEHGNPTRMIGLNWDITERKQAQLLLKASEEKYRTLVDNLSSGIVVHRPDTSVLFANPVASTLLGLSKEQMFGKTAMDPCWRFIQEDGSTLPPEGYPVVRMINSGAGFQGQVLGVCRPDLTEPVWVLCDGYPVKDAQGIFLQVVISFVDITERKQAEAEIIHLNKNLEQRVKTRTAQLEAANKEMEAFSYSVSHDLRAPLRGIDGFSQALVEDYQDRLDETGKHYISRIRAGTQRMGHLIDDLLLLSRVSRSEANRVKTDLSDLCRQVMEELTQGAPERRVEVTIQSGLSAWTDRNLLKIALENLLRNAWKFTSKREDAQIEVGELTSPSGEPVFFIRDNGAGFAMEHVGKLFDAFQRLHSASEFDGTGIGLAIVQRIINRHGGRVWAEAEPGNGATFFFTLSDRGEA